MQVHLEPGGQVLGLELSLRAVEAFAGGRTEGVIDVHGAGHPALKPSSVIQDSRPHPVDIRNAQQSRSAIGEQFIKM